MKTNTTLFFSFFCYFIAVCTVKANNSLVFTPTITTAYQYALSLRFSEARKLLSTEKTANPTNKMIFFVEDYIDFFTIFINENKTEFDQLERNKDKRLYEIEQYGDKSSPYYLYTQAEILLHWALARLKFEEYFKAFGEVDRAFKLLETNQKKFPDFVANKKSLGLLHAIIGTIPDNYKWGANLAGMNGTVAQGLAEMRQVIQYGNAHQDFVFRDENLIMYAFLLLHLGNEAEGAWDALATAKLHPQDNPLACFALANMSLHIGKTDQAIQVLMNRPTSVIYFPFPYLDMLLGCAKLYRLDPDADVYLLKYLQQHKGRHYLKEASQKLSWHYLLQGNAMKYAQYQTNIKNIGYTQVEGDKQAAKEAKKTDVPNLLLLKARLLFDGAYYRKALEALEGFSTKLSKEELEYTYRKGRIHHRLNQTNQAIVEYQKTIDAGKNSTEYFACNAALQMGILYEGMANTSQAMNYYKLCLSMQPDEYKNGLHQKAKAGLSRLKGKN